MFLRCSTRKKAGKIHRYWSIVENKRVSGGRVVQRHVLYLGEISSTQQECWERSIEVFEDGSAHPKTLSLLAAETEEPSADSAREPAESHQERMPPEVVRLQVSKLELHRPRQWGACWLFCDLYEQLGLDRFFAERLAPSRKGTRWDLILQTLCAYRLIDPGSEWRLHRHWFEQSAMADLLGEDFSLAEIHKLYNCHDLLLEHKDELFTHLQERWKDLFNARFEVLLYDLTSTYFESDPPENEKDKRRFGYSRDKRSDCVQVVIALVVTPEGFPLGYEVLAGNTSDKTTLRDFLKKIETQYGKAERIWIMDRGIPTEEVLAEMRASDPPVSYLVGTPKGRLSKLEVELAKRPWREVRESIDVKLLPEDKELYVFAQSHSRIAKERSMRLRTLRKLLKRLGELRAMKKLKRDDLLIKIGEAKKEAGRVFNLIDLQLPEPRQSVNEKTFRYALNRGKLRIVRRREGRYLLRTNLCEEDPAKLWELYMQLTQVEEAFKTIKGDLSIRPVYHQLEERIEAHIFISFLAYCVQVTLSRRLRDLAPGLTARSVLEKFASMKMLDVHVPTSDGRKVVFTRYTHPENEMSLLLERLKLELPIQPPPRITLEKKTEAAAEKQAV
jgi:transposase